MKLTKEVTLYKKDAIKTDIETAASGATNYMTDLGNGVFVYAKGNPNNPTDINAKGVLIRDDIDIIKNGRAIASFGEEINFVTDENKPRVTINQEGFKIVKKIESSPGQYSELESASFGIDEDNNSEIIFGDSNGIQNVITASKISFKDGEDEPLWIGRNNDNQNWELHSETMYIENMLRFGDFAWIKRDNKNMSLKWIGEV